MRIYIIRHADPDYERGTITSDGHKEAKALAKRMATARLDRIYTSPLGRAVHTMEYTAEQIGNVKPVVQEWMQEIDGLVMSRAPWKPLSAWNVHGEDVLAKEPYPDHTNWHEGDYFRGVPVVEKFQEIQEHSDDFFRELGYHREQGRYRRVKPHEEQIAVFCHGGFGLTWLAHLLQIPLTLMWTGFWLPPSSVTTVLFDERSSEWAVPRVIGLGDTSHLYEAGLEVKPSGIISNFY